MFLAPFGDLLDAPQLDCLFPMLTCSFIPLGGMFPPPKSTPFGKNPGASVASTKCIQNLLSFLTFSQERAGKAQSWQTRIILQQVFRSVMLTQPCSPLHHHISGVSLIKYPGVGYFSTAGISCAFFQAESGSVSSPWVKGSVNPALLALLS